MYINPNIKDLQAYQPGKTEEEIKRTYNLERVVKLSSNENPLGASEEVVQALADFDHFVTRYPEDASPELKNKLAKMNRVSSENITLGCGSSELLQMIARTFVAADGEMIITEHSFILYRILAKAVGAKLVEIPDQDFHQNIDAIVNACHENTRAIFLANPNNPTGTWLTKTQIKDLLNRVPKHVLVVIDEAYVEYMDEAQYTSAMAFLSDHDNLIVLRSFSKAYGLAGLRFGYAVSNSEITNTLARIRKAFNVTSASLIAANAVLDDKAYLEKTILTNKEGLNYLEAELNTLGLKALAKSANFLTVYFGEQSGRTAQQLLEKGVIIRPLMPYKMPHHLRISVGTMEENRIFIEELKKVL